MILIRPTIRVFDFIGNSVEEVQYITITVEDLPSILKHFKEKYPQGYRIVVDISL